jgi:hypothetical protein
MSAEDAKQKLKESIASGKSFSAADLNAAGKAPDKASAGPSGQDANAEAKTDRQTATAAGDGNNVLSAVGGPKATNEDVARTITESDKDAFLTALTLDSRMISKVAVFGGKIDLTLQSRTVRERKAIFAQLQREIVRGELKTSADFSDRLKIMLVAAQVSEMAGAESKCLCEPLFPALGSEADPDWVKGLEFWEGKSEALFSAVWDALYTFEMKYWLMTQEASNSDFWNPAASS